MNINKNEILKNICYTELVYERINKKLNIKFSKEQIEKFIFKIIKETEEKYFLKIGKNFYIANKKNNIKITINSNTFRIITVDSIVDNTQKNLQIIPGVGPKLSKEFSNIGIKQVSDLKGKDPEELYLRICAKQGTQVDPCVRYVCRSSIYFAENKNHDPEKLKWWNWKDKK